MFVREGVNFGGKELSIETGRMAKQADGAVVVRYGDTMVLVTAVASSSMRPGRGLHAAHRRLPREDVGRRAHPGRLFQARGADDRGRGADLAAHRSSVAPSVSQGLAVRHAGDRDGRLDRPRERVGRAGDDRRLDGAAPVGHPVGGPVRGRPRRPHRRQAGREPDVRRARHVRSRPARRLQPRRDRDGRGRRGRARRGRDRRRPDVRPPVGPAADRPAGEAAGRGRQAEARVRAAGQGSGDRRARSRRWPTRRSKRRWPSATSTSATRRSMRRAPRRKAALEGDVPRSRRRGRRGVRIGEEEAPARAGADHRPAHRRPRPERHPRDHLRSGRAAAHARLVAVHARRDAVAGHDHARAPARTRSTSRR